LTGDAVVAANLHIRIEALVILAAFVQLCYG
jgi:hypothetical protein